MKKIIFSLSLTLSAFAINAQKTIVVNGGRFGNSAENISVNVYDTQIKTTTTIDSIGSQSVQDILVSGNIAYVAAQDSIVRYDLSTQQRTAAVKFQGVSTKTMALSTNNELVVANWYNPFGGPALTHHLYIYDQTTLALKDSIGVQGGINSMIGTLGGVLVTQNSSTSGFSDTLGYVLIVNVANRLVVDTLRATNYSGDIGELIPKSVVTNGFYSFNSVSNTITDFSNPSIFPPYFTVNNNSTNQNLKVGSKSQYSVFGDTLFVSMNQGIGSIDLTNLAVLDSNLIDTVVTAFTYDTLNAKFYVTATDYFSYTSGKIYDRAGNYLDTFITASSPEVVRMYYDQTTGIFEYKSNSNSNFKIFPNPATFAVSIELDEPISQIVIHDMKGKLVKQVSATSTKSNIDLSSLSKGIYIVSIITGLEIQSQKLIIE